MNVKWSTLRAIGGLSIMKVTLIGPFLPFAFKAFDALANSEGLRPYLGELATGWPQSALWPLYLFYFGATFLGVASAAYLLFCPDVIKRYVDAVQYIEHESAVRSAVEVSTPEQIKVSMKTSYTHADITRPRLRALVSGLFLLGFVLLFIPPVFRFFEVLHHVARAFIKGAGL